MIKLKRLDELQGDSVLSYSLFAKRGIEIKTSLPEQIITNKKVLNTT